MRLQTETKSSKHDLNKDPSQHLQHLPLVIRGLKTKNTVQENTDEHLFSN